MQFFSIQSARISLILRLLISCCCALYLTSNAAPSSSHTSYPGNGDPVHQEDHGDHEDHDLHDHGDHDDHEEHDDHDHDDHDEHGAHDDHSNHDDHDVVRLSAELLQEFGIEVQSIGPGMLHEEVILPGEIGFNRDALASVTARYAGTVVGLDTRIADYVQSGQVLARLESIETLRPFTANAPFAGTIIDYAVSTGETVDSGQTLFTLANLSTVWADLRIYQRDMGLVREGQSVLIEGRHDSQPYRGTIAYISPIIDEHTRTGLARVIVDNSSGMWRPGAFIKGNVSIEEHLANIIVPRSAIINLEGESVVFVQTGDAFEPHPVQTGHGDAQNIEIIKGLEAGERIAVSNVISLKAELGKASFGGHAGHVH